MGREGAFESSAWMADGGARRLALYSDNYRTKSLADADIVSSGFPAPNLTEIPLPAKFPSFRVFILAPGRRFVLPREAGK
jgi:hypothetical protein